MDRYGPSGKKVSFPSTSRGRLLELAMDDVEQNKQPTITYSIEMSNGEWIALGELIKVSVPQLKREDILPVVRYETTIGKEVNTVLTLGTPKLSMADYIKLLG